MNTSEHGLSFEEKRNAKPVFLYHTVLYLGDEVYRRFATRGSAQRRIPLIVRFSIGLYPPRTGTLRQCGNQR
jgi:hypothetical protein